MHFCNKKLKKDILDLFSKLIQASNSLADCTRSNNQLKADLDEWKTLALHLYQHSKCTCPFPPMYESVCSCLAGQARRAYENKVVFDTK